MQNEIKIQTRNGGGWTDSIKKAVWNKGTILPNYSPDLWRWDKWLKYE